MNDMVTIESVVRDAMPRFLDISRSNKLVKWEEESQFALQALQGNKQLAQCHVETIQNAIINVAAVGLTLNPADQYAYLVPEHNKQANIKECKLRISFKGLIKVATESGCIDFVKCEIVKENDSFIYKGPTTAPEHQFNPFKKDRGDSVGVYSITRTGAGDTLVDFMDHDEIMKIRQCAKTMVVWDKWPDEMAKKAMVKRAAKQWPKNANSSGLNKTIEVINDLEGSDHIDPIMALKPTADAIIAALEIGDDSAVCEAWNECKEHECDTLWIAITKGGFFTQAQKDAIRKALSSEFVKNIEDSDHDTIMKDTDSEDK